MCLASRNRNVSCVILFLLSWSQKMILIIIRIDSLLDCSKSFCFHSVFVNVVIGFFLPVFRSVFYSIQLNYRLKVLYWLCQLYTQFTFCSEIDLKYYSPFRFSSTCMFCNGDWNWEQIHLNIAYSIQKWMKIRYSICATTERRTKNVNQF